MELDSRKNEAKNELKRQDIVIEVSYENRLDVVVYLEVLGNIEQMACRTRYSSNGS